MDRSTIRYRRRRGDDAALRARLRSLVGERRRFGYRRLGLLLRREGVRLNHKKRRRLYREERLEERLLSTPTRRSQARARQAGAEDHAAAPYARWSLDFAADVLADGRRFRVLCVVDDCTRECLALVADSSLSGARVANAAPLRRRAARRRRSSATMAPS